MVVKQLHYRDDCTEQHTVMYNNYNLVMFCLLAVDANN